jgi:uncharacterized protein YjbI with pentapeptide repeats
MNYLRCAVSWMRRLLEELRSECNLGPERLPAGERLAWSARTGGYNFALCDLRQGSLAGKDFSSATFFGAQLTGINASRANLERANVVGVEAARARFNGAMLDSAALLGADLRGADLSEADLRAANLSWADLRGANMSGALLEGTILSRAKYDETTRWPDGVSPAALGAVEWRPHEVSPAAAPGGSGDEPVPG